LFVCVVGCVDDGGWLVGDESFGGYCVDVEVVDYCDVIGL